MVVRADPGGRSTRGLRRLLVVVLLVLFVPVLGIQAGSYYQQYRFRRDRALADDLGAARAVADAFTVRLQELGRDEVAVGHTFVVPPSPPPDLWNGVLRRVVRDYTTLRSLSWVDLQGRILASSVPSEVGRQVAREAWFREVSAGRERVVTNLLRTASPGGSVFHVAQLVRDARGAPRGVMVASLSPDQLADWLTLPRVPDRTVSIIDASGWLVYQSPPRDLRPEQRDWLALNPAVAKALRGESQLGISQGHHLGQRHFFAMMPIPQIGWAASVADPQSQVTGPILAALTRDAAFVLALLLIAFLVAVTIAGRIAGPIERMSAYALVIGQGRFPPPPAVRGPRELTDLAGALAEMTDQLREREREHERLHALEQERAHEARLLDAIHAATSNLLVYLGSDLRLVHANPAAEALLGRTRDELAGRAAAEVFAAAPALVSLLAQCRDTGQEARLVELAYPGPGASPTGMRFLDVTADPVAGSGDAPEGVLLSAADVTARVAQRDRALEAERARAELAETLNAEITHRVKNHLMMAANLLHLQTGEEGDPRVASSLRDAASRLLTFASIHEQLQASPQGQVDLSGVLRRVVHSLKQQCGVPEGRAECSVEAEPLLLEARAATNLAVVANELLTNAAKHGGPGPDGLLRVRVRLQTEEGVVRLSVWNSGPPLPADFDAAARSRMGLRVVTGLIVSQYGGHVSLRASEGGTLAEVAVPRDALH